MRIMCNIGATQGTIQFKRYSKWYTYSPLAVDRYIYIYIYIYIHRYRCIKIHIYKHDVIVRGSNVGGHTGYSYSTHVTTVQTGPGAHPASFAMVTGPSFRG